MDIFNISVLIHLFFYIYIAIECDAIHWPPVLIRFHLRTESPENIFGNIFSLLFQLCFPTPTLLGRPTADSIRGKITF